jgi:adenine/guanine phosphoribosyltransferase-like PRPP-binding protein
MHRPQIYSDYLRSAFYRENVDNFLKAASRLVKRYDFEAFAFCGMSGALVTPLLAYKTKKTLIMVRKPKVRDPEHMDDTWDHSYLRVEGDKAAKRYLIVDDFVALGVTQKRIVEQISIFAPEARCIGSLLYFHFMSNGTPLKISDVLLEGSLQRFVVNSK